MLSETLFKRQAFHVVLLAVSRLFLNEIDYVALSGLLNISIGPLMIGRRYYGVMRLGSIEIGIQRRTSHVVLIKNGTLLVLLSAFNDVKSGCFGAVSTVILRGLACFRRKIGALSKRQLTK
jgi:hypothetical protein